jgi:hypothetical protein
MTKTLDQLLFFYYNKNDAIRVTDLHQGIVSAPTPPSPSRIPASPTASTTTAITAPC